MNCDGSLLERVFTNLLENANKYAGTEATIGIRARTLPEWLEVEVWDNGPGIPADQLQLIFDKFSRGNKESAIPASAWG